MDTVNIATLAGLLGRKEAALQQLMKRGPLRELGQVRGRERSLALEDYAAVRLAVEFQHDPRSLEQAFAMGAGLVPEVAKLVNGETDRETYALALEGVGPEAPREFVLCDGWPELARHVADALAKGWPRLQVANLRAIGQEVMTGWCFATGKAEQLAAKYRERLDTMPEAEIARAEELLALFHHRLSNRPKPAVGPTSLSAPPRTEAISAGKTTSNGTWTLPADPLPVRQRKGRELA